MSIEISPNPTKENIRVGYIDPELGFVDNVTIKQANVYAKDNPGTKFIFRDGNNVLNYLSINEVNELDGTDTLSTKECEGIQNKPIKSPVIQFFGGGGIGAIGNAVIGNDGSILSVDLEYGGNGYKYPPTVQATDFSGGGSGAVFRVGLGTTATAIVDCSGLEEILETYENLEEDTKDYGRVYDQNGQDIGPWNPKNYLPKVRDPFTQEVRRYLALLNRTSRNPFWTTRDKTPVTITSSDETINVRKLHEVEYPFWEDFLNKYAVSPVRPSNAANSDYAGPLFVMDWEVEFPYMGEYVFSGQSDSVATLYLDGERISEQNALNAKSPTIIKKTVDKGIHNVKVELLNLPISDKTTDDGFVDVTFYVAGTGDRENDYSFRFTSEDKRHSFVIDRPKQDGLIALKGSGQSGKVKAIKIPVRKKTNYKVQQVTTRGGPIEMGTLWNGYEGSDLSVPGRKGQGKRLDTIFADSLGTPNDNSDIQLRASMGLFEPIPRPPLGNRSDFDIIYRLNDGQVITNFNDNPMGIALKIDAPLPPVPKEPPIVQSGPCPPNPFWTTRSPNSSVQWYPAISKKFWGNFMNLYGISPVLPLKTGDSGSGKIFTNSWVINAPYDGIYGFRGTADYSGKFFVDGKEIAILDSAKNERPKTTRFNMSKGSHTISIELLNDPFLSNVSPLTEEDQKQSKFVNVKWTVALRPDIGRGYKYTFKEIGGNHTFEVKEPARDGSSPLTRNIKVKPNVKYRVTASADEFNTRVPNSTLPRIVIQQGTIVNGQRGGLVKSNKIFADVLGTANDENDFRVTASKGVFTPSRLREIRFSSIVRETVDLVYELKDRNAPNPPPPPKPPLPWGENPIGASAIIIAPCCPKNISGKGVVTRVDVIEPGNGFNPLISQEPDPNITTVYSVGLTITDVIIRNGGVGYGTDSRITITPDNGAQIKVKVNEFGIIVDPIVVGGGFGFTEYPTITVTGTGVNADLIPVLSVIRDPIAAPERLIQVTDLVGIKQTGYIDGRPYYGAVFYKDNVKYAGYYETVGDLVQVYDTLKESIDAKVTTPPSAIQRQGTDITSNDPRLNIPRTPQDLI